MLVAMPRAMGVPGEATLAVVVDADVDVAAVVGTLPGAPVEVAAGELVDAGIGGGLVDVGAGRVGAGAPGDARIGDVRGGRADVGVGITVFVEKGGASTLAGGG